MAQVDTLERIGEQSEGPIRMQVISRHYWPITSESALRLMHLCDGWSSIGVHPSIVTTRWNTAWPDRANIRGIPIERLLPPTNSPWNEGHFQKNLGLWLQKNRDRFDLLYVDASDLMLPSIQHKARQLGKPLLVRYTPEVIKPLRPRPFGMGAPQIEQALTECQGVVVQSRIALQKLIDSGTPSNKCKLIVDGVQNRVDRSIEARQRALVGLAKASGDFHLPPKTDLAIHLGESTLDLMIPILKSFCDLLDRGVSIRLWMFDLGKETARIYEWVKLRGWHREMLIFDGFDVLDDLIAAADLAVVSNPSMSFQFSTRLIVESELPVIIASDPCAHEWIPETPLMKWYYSHESLLDQLLDWQRHRDQWSAEAIALNNHLHRHHPIRDCIDRWKQLLQSLVPGRLPRE